jgi:23S rRNA pseudouridine2605 synthase
MRAQNQGSTRGKSRQGQRPATGSRKPFRAGQFQGAQLQGKPKGRGGTGGKEGASSGAMRGGPKGAGRRITLGEVRSRENVRSVETRREHQIGRNTQGKKLVLRREKRPSKAMMLRELGHTTEKPALKHSVEKGDLIRLNKFIANAGICSRREADTYIHAGVVKVNGQVVTELGTKVSPTDEIRFDDRIIRAERKVYVLLNKPKDVVTTTDDPHADRTVMDLVKDACEERIYPVGRLDRNTTGVLLLTNDGELSKKLTHPSHKVEKVYQVRLDKTVSVHDMQSIANGMELEDGFIAADVVSFVEGEEKDTVGIEIHSGRHRIVRRIFEKLGYRVKALDRVSFAGLTKKNLPRGRWRLLSPREVSYLKMK